MAELDFFLTEEETAALVQYIQSAGYTFVPDLFYSDEIVLRLRKLEDINFYVLKTQRFYLTHSDFTKEGFKMRPVTRDNKRVYYISQSYGGPYLDFLIPRSFEQDGVKRFSSGFISTFSKYYYAPGEPIQGYEMPLKKSYQDICKYIRKHTKVVHTSIGRAYRIYNDVLRDSNAGSILIGVTDV